MVATQIFWDFSPLKKIGGSWTHVFSSIFFRWGWLKPPTVVMFLDFQCSMDLQGPDFSWIDQIVGEDGLEAGVDEDSSVERFMKSWCLKDTCLSFSTVYSWRKFPIDLLSKNSFETGVYYLSDSHAGRWVFSTTLKASINMHQYAILH